ANDDAPPHARRLRRPPPRAVRHLPRDHAPGLHRQQRRRADPRTRWLHHPWWRRHGHAGLAL
ncbi:MAG: hypothetical protein AVDCRST_MAG40-2012, partial [uncultured Gemmatimonadaceae bacterium]